MILTDYRTRFQIELDELKAFAKSNGHTYKTVRHQGFPLHAETEIVDDSGQVYIGFGSSRTRMKALMLSEIDAVRKLLESKGVEFSFGKGEEPAEELPNESVMKVDRESVMKCKTVSDVYNLIKNDSELYDKLERHQAALIEDGKRLNVKKAAEYLFPKRSAIRIAPIEENKEKTSRGINEMFVIEAKLKEAGLKAANYGDKVNPLLTAKYANFEVFCKKATEDEISNLISTLRNDGLSNG